MFQSFLANLQVYIMFLTHRWGQILYFTPENPAIGATTWCSFANLAAELKEGKVLSTVIIVYILNSLIYGECLCKTEQEH